MVFKLPGVDEFTSHLIKKSAEERSPLQDAGVDFVTAKDSEIKDLQGVDPYEVAKDMAGGEPSLGEELRSAAWHRGMINERLKAVGDVHDRMSRDEVVACLQEGGFQLGVSEPSSFEGEDRFEAWGDPRTGAVVSGAVYERGSHGFKMYVQWCQDLDHMNEREEVEVCTRVDRVFGGTVGRGFTNPLRPDLHHGALHHHQNYADITDAEREVWSKDYNGMPERIARERGKSWAHCITADVRGGVFIRLRGLDRLEGRFEQPWVGGFDGKFLIEDAIGDYRDKEALVRRLASAESWFREMVSPALGQVATPEANVVEFKPRAP